MTKELIKDIRQTLEILWRNKIGDFGITMAGRYRCQGMMEFWGEVDNYLKELEEEAGK